MDVKETISGKLLWVDDEIEMLRAQILFLEKKGYEVVKASNGSDAIDWCQNQYFDLILLDEPVITGPNLQKTGSGKIKMSKSLSVSPELMLLGKTVDEALAELDKYLDDAYLAHIPQVRIVHGKGTGALRTAVHNYLRRQKHVKSYRLGTFGEGDAGVTIVDFKS